MLLRFTLVVLALLASAQWVPGIDIDSLYITIIVAMLFGFLNVLLKPLIMVATLPVHTVTLGFSILVVNALMLWFLSTFVQGFTVAGFMPALIGAFILAGVNVVANLLNRDKN